MTTLELNDTVYHLTFSESSHRLELRPPSGPHIFLLPDGEGAKELRDAIVPPQLLNFLQAFTSDQSRIVEKMRIATADKLWGEYAEGPHGGWRTSSGAAAQDKAAFGVKLGSVDVSFVIEKDGIPSMAEFWWEDKEMFLGHSIFIQVFDLENWEGLDASIFG